MQKRNSLFLGIILLFTLTACSNTAEKDYQKAINSGNDAITEEHYTQAIDFYEDALTHKESDTLAQNVIDQIEAYQEAEQAEKDGELTKAKALAQVVSEMKKGSDTLVQRANRLLKEMSVLEEDVIYYQGIYNQGKKEYEAHQYDAAGGTIQLLLAENLNHKAFDSIKEEATTLQKLIVTAQKEQQAEKAEASAEANSEYTNERRSELVSQEFLSATGKEIQNATDGEVSTWLSEKEKAEAQPSPVRPAETEADKKLAVQQEVVQITGYSDSTNQYYVTAVNDDLYQVEIRNSQSLDGAEVSNMVGMFQYIPSTKALTKMDPITGEYSLFKAH